MMAAVVGSIKAAEAIVAVVDAGEGGGGGGAGVGLAGCTRGEARRGGACCLSLPGRMVPAGVPPPPLPPRSPLTNSSCAAPPPQPTGHATRWPCSSPAPTGTGRPWPSC